MKSSEVSPIAEEAVKRAIAFLKPAGVKYRIVLGGEVFESEEGVFDKKAKRKSLEKWYRPQLDGIQPGELRTVRLDVHELEREGVTVGRVRNAIYSYMWALVGGGVGAGNKYVVTIGKDKSSIDVLRAA